MEQKNFLLAMVLIVSFLLMWSMFVVPRFTPAPVPQVPAAGKDLSKATPNVPAELKSAHEAMGHPVALTDTILRDQNNEIVLTPKGGAIKGWRLKSKGEEVELVLHPDQTPLPLTSFPEAVYKIALPSDRRAVLSTTLTNGLRVIKTLTLSQGGYLHQLSYRFENPTAQPIELSKWEWGWGPGLGTSQFEQKENPSMIRAITLGKLKLHVLEEGEPAEFGRWAALDNRYFLVAFIPRTSNPDLQVTGSNDQPPRRFDKGLAPLSVDLKMTGSKDKTLLQLIETTQVPARGTVTLNYDLYVGPKGYTQLKKYDRGLEASVDFGFFSWLGRQVLNALYYLKSLTGNYGIAIILLTIAIQILMFPLTVKSFKATLAMKKLQPKIAEIQARFKSDPKRLNVEMMNVYKTSGTNPFGGCLPMLLQLPIFWALFTTLRNAYELRGAPFILWMRDLSAPDVLFQVSGFPLHALPLIMGGAMFVQQRMSGAVSDPTQRQMMTIMPIMFTFMFYGFPSGLVLYWLTNNIMTMAFQYGFQRFTQDPSRVIDTKIVK